MRRFGRSWVPVIALATALSVVLPIGALAQEAEQKAEDEGPHPLQKEADSLLARLDKRVDDIREWTEILETTQGDDRKAIELELAEERLVALADLRRIVDNVVAQEEAGLDASSIRKRIEGPMKDIPERIQQFAEEAAEEASNLRLEREETSAEELLGLEQQIAKAGNWVNRFAEAYVDHLNAMNALELDTTAPQAWVTDALSKRATFLGRRLELAQTSKVELTQQLNASPEDAALTAALQAAERRIDGDVHDLRVTLKLLEELGVDATEQQRQLADATGEIVDLLDKDVAVGMVGNWLTSAKEWIADNGVRLLAKIVVFILILLVFRTLAKLARRVAVRSLKSSKVKISRLLEDMILSMIQRIVMIFGLLVALAQFGVELGPLLAGLGVAGFIVGFALQGVLSNFASGVMILFYRPFDVEDVVEVAGVFGKVDRMTLVSTTILTFDNQTLVVPNTMIWGDVIKNVTAQEERRVDLIFGISYQDEIPKAEKLLAEIVEAHPKVLKDPAPQVKVHNLGESSVDFVVRPWVKTDDYWDVYWDLTREVKMRFDAEGVSIPFPQRDVHLFTETSSPA